MTISGGNVGIGTDSPTAQLHIKGSANANMILEAGSTTDANFIYFGDSAGLFRGGFKYDHSADSLGIYANGLSTPDITLDSSGNLLVGKTANDNTTAGFKVQSGGFFSAVADGTTTCVLNRLTSDGDIAIFRKNGATVGSIGCNDNDPYIARAGGNGFRWYSGAVVPTNDSGATADNVMDLGSSIGRFKDLYLSGGAYLGGTGSANHLDDYEEGTFTPVVSVGVTSPVYGSQGASYVKIGKLVTFQLTLTLSGGTANASHLKIGGLPFTSSSQSNYGGAFFNYSQGFITDIGARTMHIAANGTLISFYKTDGGQLAGTEVDDITSTLLINGQYEVS